MTNHDILLLSLYIAGGFVIGFLLHKWAMPLLSRLAARTKLQSDDVIIGVIRSWIIAWLVALGLFLGLHRIEMEAKHKDWLENGLVIFYIFSLTMIVGRIVSGLMQIKARGTNAVIPSSSIISNIVKIIIYCLGLVLILQSVGISVTPILTALGVGGLAVALALQDTLTNLFAGLQIIASGKINPGDFVQLDSGQDGFVQDITWRSTTIRTVADNMIIVPNSKLSTMIVTNFNLPKKEVGFAVEVGVSYDSDLRHVESVTKEVIRETMSVVEGGSPDYEPLIRFYAFGENSVNFRAILRVDEHLQQFPAQHEFIKRLHERYQKEGIQIPFPIRTVYLKKEE